MCIYTCITRQWMFYGYGIWYKTYSRPTLSCQHYLSDLSTSAMVASKMVSDHWFCTVVGDGLTSTLYLDLKVALVLYQGSVSQSGSCPAYTSTRLHYHTVHTYNVHTHVCMYITHSCLGHAWIINKHDVRAITTLVNVKSNPHTYNISELHTSYTELDVHVYNSRNIEKNSTLT